MTLYFSREIRLLVLSGWGCKVWISTAAIRNKDKEYWIIHILTMQAVLKGNLTFIPNFHFQKHCQSVIYHLH